jgi:holliday junction DNA helicase RuvA
MIGQIRGEVIDVESNAIVVDVQGVGYVLSVAMGGAYTLSDQVELFVHTHVREDALQLFGFRSKVEREVFNLLTTVPSIGPSKAIGIMATPIAEIVQFVSDEDVKRLTKLPGIGKKTAERMLVDLKDKFRAIGLEVSSAIPAAAATESQLVADILSALGHLGFKPSAAGQAAKKAIQEMGDEGGFDTILKRSLDYLRTL